MNIQAATEAVYWADVAEGIAEALEAERWRGDVAAGVFRAFARQPSVTTRTETRITEDRDGTHTEARIVTVTKHSGLRAITIDEETLADVCNGHDAYLEGETVPVADEVAAELDALHDAAALEVLIQIGGRQ